MFFYLYHEDILLKKSQNELNVSVKYSQTKQYLLIATEARDRTCLKFSLSVA